MANSSAFSIFKSKNKHRDEVDKLEGSLHNVVDAPLAVILPVATDNDRYKVSNDNIGIALIFDHKVFEGLTKRCGTKCDRRRIAKAYKSYGFDVRIYKDLSYTEIVNTLTEVSKLDHSKNDCFVVTVMSHGSLSSLYAKDKKYLIDTLWNPFLANKCPSLVGKPKLFFIQACRGDLYDCGVLRTYDIISVGRYRKVKCIVPTTADILVMYSTFIGFSSWRNPVNGSWFIQCLAHELEISVANEFGTDLYYLLTSVARSVAKYESKVPLNRSMNKKKEMPTFVSTLTKNFTLKKKLNNDTV